MKNITLKLLLLLVGINAHAGLPPVRIVTPNGLLLVGTNKISLQAGSSSQPGAITAADWSAFNVGGAGISWIVPVKDVSNADPGSPSNGDRQLVGSSGSGLFSGHSNAVATFSSGTPSSGPVDWNMFNNTTAVGGALTFGAGSFSNNSAITVQTIQNDGDYYQFQLNAAAMGENVTVGVTHVPFSSGNGPGQTDIGMNFSTDGQIYSFESDANYTVISTSWTPSDTFKLQVNGSSIAFYQNGSLLATDGFMPTFPLYGANSASTGSTTITVTESYSIAGAGSWAFVSPIEGWMLNVESKGLYQFHSGGWFNLSSAPKISYAPVTPANWASTPPANVQDAIDRMAAVVSVGGTSPIP